MRFLGRFHHGIFKKPLLLLVPGDGFEPPTNGLQNGWHALFS
jgi:hypothetical protein